MLSVSVSLLLSFFLLLFSSMENIDRLLHLIGLNASAAKGKIVKNFCIFPLVPWADSSKHTAPHTKWDNWGLWGKVSSWSHTVERTANFFHSFFRCSIFSFIFLCSLAYLTWRRLYSVRRSGRLHPTMVIVQLLTYVSIIHWQQLPRNASHRQNLNYSGITLRCSLIISALSRHDPWYKYVPSPLPGNLLYSLCSGTHSCPPLSVFDTTHLKLALEFAEKQYLVSTVYVAENKVCKKR